MKTFEEHCEEVAEEKRTKFGDMIIERFTPFGVKEVAIEAAKRYARQCCEDVLKRAAESATAFQSDLDLSHWISEESITSTEIITP